MRSSDLFSHPVQPEHVADNRDNEPVAYPVFSDAPESKKSRQPTA